MSDTSSTSLIPLYEVLMNAVDLLCSSDVDEDLVTPLLEKADRILVEAQEPLPSSLVVFSDSLHNRLYLAPISTQASQAKIEVPEQTVPASWESCADLVEALNALNHSF